MIFPVSQHQTSGLQNNTATVEPQVHDGCIHYVCKQPAAQSLLAAIGPPPPPPHNLLCALFWATDGLDASESAAQVLLENQEDSESLVFCSLSGRSQGEKGFRVALLAHNCPRDIIVSVVGAAQAKLTLAKVTVVYLHRLLSLLTCSFRFSPSTCLKLLPGSN